MTSKRRTPARVITPNAIELFRRLVELEEREGERGGEYWELESALSRELHLRPWVSPMEDEKIYNALMAALHAHAS